MPIPAKLCQFLSSSFSVSFLVNRQTDTHGQTLSTQYLIDQKRPVCVTQLCLRNMLEYLAVPIAKILRIAGIHESFLQLTLLRRSSFSR